MIYLCVAIGLLSVAVILLQLQVQKILNEQRRDWKIMTVIMMALNKTPAEWAEEIVSVDGKLSKFVSEIKNV